MLSRHKRKWTQWEIFCPDNWQVTNIRPVWCCPSVPVGIGSNTGYSAYLATQSIYSAIVDWLTAWLLFKLFYLPTSSKQLLLNNLINSAFTDRKQLHPPAVEILQKLDSRIPPLLGMTSIVLSNSLNEVHIQYFIYSVAVKLLPVTTERPSYVRSGRRNAMIWVKPINMRI